MDKCLKQSCFLPNNEKNVLLLMQKKCKKMQLNIAETTLTIYSYTEQNTVITRKLLEQ